MFAAVVALPVALSMVVTELVRVENQPPGQKIAHRHVRPALYAAVDLDARLGQGLPGAASAAARRRRRISEPLRFLLPDLAGGLEFPLDKERLDQLIQEGRNADEDADDSLH